MHELTPLLFASGAGGLIGAMFFGGLWWSVRRSLVSRHPALLTLSSLLLRLGLALPAFYFVADGRWERTLACLFGFLVARLLVIRLSAHAAGSPPRSPHGATDAA